MLTYTGITWSEELGIWAASATNGFLFYSRTGNFWNYTYDFPGEIWRTITYGLTFSGIGVFLAGSDSKICRSTNGVNFTSVFNSPSKKLLYAEGYFLSFIGNQICYKSSDGGLSWTATSNIPYNGSNIYFDAAYGKGIIVAISSSPNAAIVYSNDFGGTWQTATMPSRKWSAIVHDGNKFILSAGVDNEIYSSIDGNSWSLIAGAPLIDRFGVQNGSVIGTYTGVSNAYITANSGVSWTTENLSSLINTNAIGCRIQYIQPTTTSTSSTTSTSTSSTTSTSTSSTTSTSTSSTTSTSTSSTTSTSTSSTTSTSTSSTTSTSTSSTTSTSTSSTTTYAPLCNLDCDYLDITYDAASFTLVTNEPPPGPIYYGKLLNKELPPAYMTKTATYRISESFGDTCACPSFQVTAEVGANDADYILSVEIWNSYQSYAANDPADTSVNVTKPSQFDSGCRVTDATGAFVRVTLNPTFSFTTVPAGDLFVQVTADTRVITAPNNYTLVTPSEDYAYTSDGSYEDGCSGNKTGSKWWGISCLGKEDWYIGFDTANKKFITFTKNNNLTRYSTGSTDLTWTNGGYLPTSDDWKSSASDGSSQFTVINSGSTYGYTTNYGSSWLSGTLPTSSNNFVFYSSSIATWIVLSTGTTLAYSTNGTTWSTTTLPVNATWIWGFEVGGTVYLFASNGNILVSSPSSLTGAWTSKVEASLSGVRKLAYGYYTVGMTTNHVLIAIMAGTTFYRSTDLTGTWSAITVPSAGTNEWVDIVYGNGNPIYNRNLFIAVQSSPISGCAIYAKPDDTSNFVLGCTSTARNIQSIAFGNFE